MRYSQSPVVLLKPCCLLTMAVTTVGVVAVGKSSRSRTSIKPTGNLGVDFSISACSELISVDDTVRETVVQYDSRFCGFGAALA